MTFYRLYGWVSRLIHPNGIFRSTIPDANSVVAGITFVWAVGAVGRRHQSIHGNIVFGDVVDGRICGLLELQSALRIGNHFALESDPDSCVRGFNRYGMIRSRDFHCVFSSL